MGEDSIGCGVVGLGYKIRDLCEWKIEKSQNKFCYIL